MSAGRRHPWTAPADTADLAVNPTANVAVNPAANLTANLVIIGRVGPPHGVAGELRITSSTAPPENIEQYRPWLLGDGEQFDEVTVCWMKRHGRGYLVGLDGVTDRDAAGRLSGLLVAVPRSALPALETDDEYYWQDLIGSSVVNTAGRLLGTVTRLLDTGAHDVLVISGAGEEHLVPFVAAFVLEVDLADRRILVDWQEPD